MGGFSFAPRRRSYSTIWQLILIAFRKLIKIITVHLINTQQVGVDLVQTQEITVDLVQTQEITVDLVQTQEITANLISTESVDIEVENC